MSQINIATLNRHCNVILMYDCCLGISSELIFNILLHQLKPTQLTKALELNFFLIIFFSKKKLNLNRTMLYQRYFLLSHQTCEIPCITKSVATNPKDRKKIMFSYQVPKILRMLPTRLLGPLVSKYQWFVYLGRRLILPLVRF